MKQISEVVQKADFSNEDERDGALFTLRHSVDAIQAWKAHQLRVINQDEARIHVMESLDDETILVTQDFAMKFLPLQYREAQTEFFGKRGISWHVTVCLRRNEFTQKFESLTFIHIVNEGLQDSSCVVPIMENVLTSVKHDMPKMRKAVYRQDNAGCYHCVSTVLACKQISERTGIHIEQLDFSDPQGGKGACDRKAAQIKSYLRSFVNEGNSITNAQEMKTAIERSKIPGVRVAMVSVHCTEMGQEQKLEGISSFNNFVFSDEGVRAFKAYGIGKGQMISWSKFDSKLLLWRCDSSVHIIYV